LVPLVERSRAGGQVNRARREPLSGADVYVASDLVNAEIVKDMLCAHGIDARVELRNTWVGTASLPAGLAPRVRVSDPVEQQRARELIAAFERGPVDAGQAWTCPGCGEFILGQFDRCWLCDTPREH
jgi:hypothetical protein